MALLKLENRAVAYLLLLGDEYPSTDEGQTAYREIPYLDAERDLHRWISLAKWVLAMPHYLMVMILIFLLVVVVLAAWFATMLTDCYPHLRFGP